MRRSTSGQVLPALDAYPNLLVRIAREIARLEMRDRQQRAGLGHAIAREYVDAAIHRLFRQRLRQRRAANDHLQSSEIDVGLRRRVEQHLENCRHAVGEGYALGLDQLDKERGVITAGIDLLRASERRRPGKAPRVNMEHRGHRHIDVVAMESTVVRRQAEQGELGHRVQNQLAVAVVDAFGLAGGAGRVEGRRLGVFVEIRKVKIRGCGRKELLILADKRKVASLWRLHGRSSRRAS